MLPIIAIATLSSCSNTDDDTTPVNPDEKYLSGFFITNEGSFGKIPGSVSHLSADFNTVSNDIFKAANSRVLGDVVQDLIVYGDYVFVIVNNSNTIEVVNKKTFQSVHTITEGLSTPYYGAITNNKLYVTSLYDATVSVFNAETFAFIKKIELNHAAANIVATNDYVYAANGFYSGGTAIEIIDPITDTNSKDLAFDKAINGVATNGQFVYVLETNDQSSKISKIDGVNFSNSINLSSANTRYLVADKSDLYYTAGTGVYKLSPTLAEPGNKLFDVTEAEDGFSTFYGFNVWNGNIFASDAKGFSDNGTVTIYKEDGTKIKEITTKIGPNGFYQF